MLKGKAMMIVDKEEIIQAVNFYFMQIVSTQNILQPYAKVVDVQQMKSGEYRIYLEGEKNE